MAFGRKAEALSALSLDLAVVPECSCRDLLAASDGAGRWCGDNKAKGLGMYSPSRRLQLHPVDDISGNFRWLLPVRTSGLADLRLLGVWSFNYRQPNRRTLPQALAEKWSAYGTGAPTVVLGDFNNSAIWDTPKKRLFAETVALLRRCGLLSAYHELSGDDFGAEQAATYWQYGQVHRGYHIDYCFLPEDWLPRVRAVAVGGHPEWSRLSDHAPLVVDLALP